MGPILDSRSVLRGRSGRLWHVPISRQAILEIGLAIPAPGCRSGPLVGKGNIGVAETTLGDFGARSCPRFDRREREENKNSRDDCGRQRYSVSIREIGATHNIHLKCSQPGCSSANASDPDRWFQAFSLLSNPSYPMPERCRHSTCQHRPNDAA